MSGDLEDVLGAQAFPLLVFGSLLRFRHCGHRQSHEVHVMLGAGQLGNVEAVPVDEIRVHAREAAGEAAVAATLAALLKTLLHHRQVLILGGSAGPSSLAPDFRLFHEAE